MKKFPLEALIWIVALLIAATFKLEETHFSVCPIALTGLDFCPGCGLGRSISLLLHGEVLHSLEAHPLGIFAVCILTHRIITLTKTTTPFYGKNHRHTT